MSGDDDGAAADAEATGPMTVALHNLCDKPQWWVVIDGDQAPNRGIGASDDPNADPAEKDADMRKNLSGG